MADYSRYLKLIPPSNQGKLDNELNWQGGDVDEIAESLSKWQQNLRVALELTMGDLDVINSVSDPILKRYIFH